MIGCYLTGILPRPKRLIEVTRAYVRGRIDDHSLERTFQDATQRVVDTQLSAELTYVTDGMLRWQDIFTPFTQGLHGVETGSLARWFDNNTFYRTPLIVGDIQREKNIVEEATYLQHLPQKSSWKAVLPAPYTFSQLSENRFYDNKTELMFQYARILNQEINSLTEVGFKYIQLSDPALVYKPIAGSISGDQLTHIKESIKMAVEGVSVKTCLQTFFGDFSQILPEALDFPVNHLGIDLYETDLDNLKEYRFGRGVALGLVDSRNSLIEDPDELVAIAQEIIESIYRSETGEVYVCPNCDLEFLTWEKAAEKIEVIRRVTDHLREVFP